MASGGEDTSSVTTQVLDGKSIASDVRRQVAGEIAQIKSSHPNFHPKLVIIQVNHGQSLSSQSFRYTFPFSALPSSPPRLGTRATPMSTYE